MIGDRTAEDIKMAIGSAFPEDADNMFEIKGRDLVTGLPKIQEVSAKEINNAMKEPINAIVEAIKITLEKTPPELAADIMDRGIVMTGGGALLNGLDRLIGEETGMPVVVAENPLDCVVIGAGKVLDNLDLLNRVALATKSVK